MKFVTGLILLSLALFRFSLWRYDLEAAKTICSVIGVSRKSFLYQEFTGSLVPSSQTHWELSDPRFQRGQQSFRFMGRLFLESGQLGQSPQFGRKVRIRGCFHCSHPYRNPSRVRDGLLSFRLPRVYASGKSLSMVLLPERSGWLSRVRTRIIDVLGKSFQASPQVGAWMRALWTGDSSGLPPEIWQFYREGGLLHVLALSGQHVCGFVLLLGLILKGIAWLGRRFLPWIRGCCFAYQWLPLFCSGFLFLASGGLPSIQRTLFMVACHQVLSLRNLHSTYGQKFCSSLALLIAWDPGLLGKPGFFLSALATSFLVCLFCAPGAGGHRLRAYFLVSLLMPFLMHPWTAFFFAKIAWTAPLYNLVLSWLWSWVLIPIGYALPIVLAALPHDLETPLLRGMEALWKLFLSGNLALKSWVDPVYQSILCPNWLELFLITAMLLEVIVQRSWSRGGKGAYS